MGKLKTTWINLRRSPYQTLAAVAIMTLTLFVASIFLLLAFGSQKILNYFEAKPQITAFFKDEVKIEEIEGLKQKLASTGWVASQKYVSKEEALAIYKEQNKNDPLLLEMVTANILPASLEVSATEVRSLSELNEILKESPLVEEVIFQKDVVDTLISWTNALRRAGIVLLAFLVSVSLLIVLLVIGMKISQKREEIEIFKLMGASSGYIRWPFIFEGAFYGMAGAILAWGFSYLLILYATPFLASFLAGIPLLPMAPILMLELLGLLVLGGVLVGAFGSLLAVWRYLND